ncbi:MAG: peptide chain release factor N(5)-glutamine methyltransferase [Ginsengibacter sp.]
MTTENVYTNFLTRLKTIYEEREAANIADWVFENVTGLKKWERRINKKNELSENEFNHLQNSLEQLLQHKPVQYILQEAWFYKMKFFVNENVLIPRPETEELVEWIINDQNNATDSSEATLPTGRQVNIIDIGTGSGCIAIALKREIQNANLSAVDASEKALTVAKKNASDLKAEIDFMHFDFLNEKEWQHLPSFDIVVSNPPYIPIKEKELLAKNVTKYEPGVALFVEDNDPFIFYKKIAVFSKTHLNTIGKIYVEVHENSAREVKKIFEEAGFISEIKKDIYGKERMVQAF